MAIRAVEIRAQLWRITSRMDHSFDVTLKTDEECLRQIQEMMGHNLEEVRVVMEFDPQNRERSGDDRPGSKNRALRSGKQS